MVVDRTNIISARKFASDDSGVLQTAKDQARQDESIADESLLKASSRRDRLRECVTVDTERNRFTLTHNGNALGILGTQSGLDVFSTTTQQLIEKIGGIGPGEINFGGNEASLEVDLGETTLKALAQTIAQGRTSGGGANDPAIANARAMIELALTGDPADMTQIITALNIIKEKLGPEATASQALSLAYGGTTLVAPNIDLPDVLIKLLSDPEDGLAAELNKLRFAFEATQELATSLSTNVGQENEVYVNILNEQLPLVLQKQDELIAVLSARLSQNVESPVMVTPIVLSSNLSGPSQDSVLTQSIFQTSIEVSGSPANPVTTIGNTLVLPFFTEPVLDGDEPLINPQRAFNWGANVNNLKDPVVAEDMTTYFERVADTLSSCLAGGATLDLDIIGLASRSWDGPTGGFPRAKLNYFLAEGRRIAAMRLLGEFISASDQRDRILVQLADGQFTPLSDILRADTGNADAFINGFGRFNGQSGFESRRDALIAVAGLSDDEKNPLEELFARSVVLSMIDAEQGPCRF